MTGYQGATEYEKPQSDRAVLPNNIEPLVGESQLREIFGDLTYSGIIVVVDLSRIPNICCVKANHSLVVSMPSRLGFIQLLR